MSRQQAFKAFGAELLDGIQGLATLKAFGQSTSYARTLAARARDPSNSTMQLSSPAWSRAASPISASRSAPPQPSASVLTASRMA